MGDTAKVKVTAVEIKASGKLYFEFVDNDGMGGLAIGIVVDEIDAGEARARLSDDHEWMKALCGKRTTMKLEVETK